jgi:hypothetical protein
LDVFSFFHTPLLLLNRTSQDPKGF